MEGESITKNTLDSIFCKCYKLQNTPNMETITNESINKYLSFILDDEYYAINVLKIAEIIGMHKTTPIPNTPPYVIGVMNLRGRIIPVFDLKLKLMFSECIVTEYTCNIVVQVEGNTKNINYFALRVDATDEVFTITSSEIEMDPSIKYQKQDPYICGIFNRNETIIRILDIEQLIVEEDMILQ